METASRFPIRTILLLLLLFGVSLTVHFCASSFIDSEIKRRVRDYVILRPGKAKDTYERFLGDINYPDGEVYYTKFYFFNITNLDDVRNGSKPILKQVGPYTYRIVEEKYDVSFYWNGSVAYREKAMYYEEPKLSKGSFDDKIVTLNMVLSGVLGRLYDQSDSWIIRAAVSRLASTISHRGSATNQGLFLTRTVDELLWGYNETMLGLLSHIPGLHIDPEFSLLENTTATEKPGLRSMINTGINDQSLLGELETWEGKREISGWKNYVEPVHGSMGDFFKPFLKSDDDLAIWIPQMYRAMDMYNAEQSEVYGVKTHRYRIKPQFWDVDERYYVKYRGLINVTAFSLNGGRGPPLYFSTPHFCDADPKLSDFVVGLNCDPSKHEFYIDVEPYTGISTRGVVRLMVSSEFSSKFSAIDSKLKETVLPIFWLELLKEATSAQLKPVRDELYLALRIKHQLSLSTLIISVVLGGFIFILLVKPLQKRLKQSPQQSIPQTDQNAAPLIPSANA